MGRGWFTRFSCAFGLLSFIVGPVAAQDAPRPQPYGDLSLVDLLELRLESASKRAQGVGDAPASVVILSRQDIERMGYSTLEELVANIPGFFLVDNYEDHEVGVRGVLDAGVQFLINGVPVHPYRTNGLTLPERSRFNVPIEAIDRLEVIRGPMSVIYGNNAFAGVVNIITNEVETDQTRVSASYGENGTRRAFARQGVTLFEGRGSAVVNAGYYRTDGIRGALSDAMSDDQLAGVDPTMRQSLDGLVGREHASIDASFAYEGLRTDFRFSHMDIGLYAFTPAFHDGSQLELENWQGSVTYERSLTDELRFRTWGVYSRENYDAEFDFIVPQQEATQKQWSNRLEYEFNGVWNPLEQAEVLVGYNHQSVFNTENRAEVEAPPVDAVIRNPWAMRNDVFAEASVAPIPALKASAGTRVSSLSPVDVRRNDSPDSHIDGALLVTPRFSLISSLPQGQYLKLLFGMATQDDRSSRFSERETMRSSELAYLSASSKHNVQVSAYFNQINNILRTVQRVDEATGAYVNDTDNSGEWSTRGAEVMGSLQPFAGVMEGLRLDASANVQSTVNQNNPEIEPDDSPHWLLKARMSYVLSGVSAGAGVHFVDKMLPTFQWDGAAQGAWTRIGDEVPAYALVTGNLRYDDRFTGFYLNLHASNLLNREFHYAANELVSFQRGGFALRREVMLTAGINLE